MYGRGHPAPTVILDAPPLSLKTSAPKSCQRSPTWLSDQYQLSISGNYIFMANCQDISFKECVSPALYPGLELIPEKSNIIGDCD